MRANIWGSKKEVKKVFLLFNCLKMLQIKVFTFSLFSENTYILIDENQDCVVIDPGCYAESEKQLLLRFLTENKLQLKAVWLTHGHVDHIFGLDFLKKQFNMPIIGHSLAKIEIERSLQYAAMYGTPMSSCPPPDSFVSEGDTLTLGANTFSVLFTPGHSPGSISFYCEKENLLVSGDVLFQDSVGRWDLPGGNFETLMQSITNKLLPLPDDTTVYSGHGASTKLGREKQRNPYILQYLATKK